MKESQTRFIQKYQFFCNRFVITSENGSCPSLFILSVPAWAALEQPPWGHAYSKPAQGRGSSPPWHESITSLKYITSPRSREFRPDLSTPQEGIHAGVMSSPTRAVPRKHLHSHRQELGRFVSAGSRAVSWWVRVRKRWRWFMSYHALPGSQELPLCVCAQPAARRG